MPMPDTTSSTEHIESQASEKGRSRGQRGEGKASPETRDRLLRAAAHVFRHKGYVAATLAEIGQLADLRPATILYHFASKEALLEEVMTVGLGAPQQEVQRRLASAPRDATAADRLRIAIIGHLSALLMHNDFTAAGVINFHLAPPALRKRHHEKRSAYGDVWRELLRQAKDEGYLAGDVDLTVLRLFMIGGLNWSHEWYDPKGGRSIEAIGSDIARIVLGQTDTPLPA
ncbi:MULTISPECIES: TetR/AcrR family transcriptional regulator [Bordetella]|uniref:TetR family transcriptional regulator n=8 Tax=Bordetella TaxID=517 RepID=Q7VSS9_BORPE|nr:MULTISPECIES: TetR/AcrR family transcriptional regulator [Bordetella]AEE68956.1 TetR family transcriptional regulator [Bordetella pertussis CS]KCV21784.1 transcriptional regulator, TetR family [Bordetella pertussis H934]CAE31131.1 TetR family transcriptional regulator [Bordetella bronchiseptica RB50]CAE44101.1 TetR family transcriptional regulator [Bordetella pertussis Tohama I]CCJ54725.1 TetR family transcriptional regulator [Bordetella bronchiseptica 253]